MNILKGPHFPLGEFPVGRKDGMYYVLDDTSNIERQKIGKASQHWDDSGVWGKSSTQPTPFVFRNEKWRSVRLRDKLYCNLRYRNKQEEYIPLKNIFIEVVLAISSKIYTNYKLISHAMLIFSIFPQH